MRLARNNSYASAHTLAEGRNRPETDFEIPRCRFISKMNKHALIIEVWHSGGLLSIGRVLVRDINTISSLASLILP